VNGRFTRHAVDVARGDAILIALRACVHDCWLFLREGSCTLLRNLEQPRDVDPEVKGRLQGLRRSGLGATQIHPIRHARWRTQPALKRTRHSAVPIPRVANRKSGSGGWTAVYFCLVSLFFFAAVSADFFVADSSNRNTNCMQRNRVACRQLG